MMVYVWGRRHQYVNLNFLGLFNFTAPYLPWVLLAFSVMLGSSPVVDLMGMAAGARRPGACRCCRRCCRRRCCALQTPHPRFWPHPQPGAHRDARHPPPPPLPPPAAPDACCTGHVYYFLEDVYPRMSGGRRPLKTPAFMRALVPVHDPLAPAMGERRGLCPRVLCRKPAAPLRTLPLLGAAGPPERPGWAAPAPQMQHTSSRWTRTRTGSRSQRTQRQRGGSSSRGRRATTRTSTDAQQ
jgi:hypothetical protein